MSTLFFIFLLFFSLLYFFSIKLGICAYFLGIMIKTERGKSMKNPKLTVTLSVILVIVLAFAMSAESLSKMGSRGTEVRNIQTRLKNWGYYSGTVDGIYGTKTRDAVKKFQKANGLTVDGIAGKATLEKIGLPTGSSSGGSGYSSSDYYLLARLISAEARGEPYIGQVAVGAVVMNRTAHPSFPDTVAGVIYQKGAFSCLYDGQFDKPVSDSAYSAARDALNGYDPSGGAIYYFNPKTATSSWIWSRPLIKVIGNHRFCS